jgi:hypothetical protein
VRRLQGLEQGFGRALHRVAPGRHHDGLRLRERAQAFLHADAESRGGAQRAGFFGAHHELEARLVGSGKSLPNTMQGTDR